MHRFAVSLVLALAVCGWFASVSSAQAEDRTADQILQDLKAAEIPKLDPTITRDQQAMNKFRQEFQAAQGKRIKLIGELYKAAPEREELNTLLPERWQVLMMTDPKGVESLKDELAAVLTKSKNAKLKADAAYWKAVGTFRSNPDPKACLAAADEFIKVAPKDERGAILLYSAANQIDEGDQQTTLFKRVAHDYPETRFAKMVQGTLKRLEAVGKPFDIEFTDAIKGTTVSMKTLKGKVVVIDFWATWCGPCVAEMPTMKKLYAEYKDKGVEFIGVSLDEPKEEGGLDKLKDFVAKNEIGWPQYYQGKGWQGDFSTAWGINSIPAVFIVDAQGKLYSVNARGKLDELIPALLKKASAKSDAGAGGN